MSRRHWWNEWRTTTTEGEPMGTDWAGHTPRVSNVERPRISHPETEYSDKAEAAADQRISDALAEGERNRALLAEDERLYRVALTEFEQRVKALPELGGALGSLQQAAELDAIATLLVTAQSRGTIMRARRKSGTGLYRQMTGQELPTYQETVPEHLRPVPLSNGVMDWCESTRDGSRCQWRRHFGTTHSFDPAEGE